MIHMIIAHTAKGERIELRCNQLFGNNTPLIEDSKVIDLLNIFLEVFVTDISTDGYSRNMQVKAYVDSNNYSLWNENCKIIETLLRFVTEGDKDIWKVVLEPVEYEVTAQQLSIVDSGADNVSLLSGGLDSFCGAYRNEMENKDTLYCGYKINIFDVSAINHVVDFLKERSGYAGIQTYSRVDKKKKKLTQRTRSLLFFSLATITAVKEKIKIININENGIMTLNPSFQSRGTTKTTHPKTLYLFQTILNNVGINVQLKHPFLYTTKGQMVNSLSREYKNHIKDTRSCSRSGRDRRYKITAKRACGTCVPCLLRKISMAAYDLEGLDNDYVIPYNGDMYDEEYRSSLYYYTTFNNYIKSGQIFSELVLKRKFYHEEDYYERTYEMLNKFSEEFEVFLKKYGG